MEQNLLKLLEASINAQLQIPRILPDPKEGGTLIIY